MTGAGAGTDADAASGTSSMCLRLPSRVSLSLSLSCYLPAGVWETGQSVSVCTAEEHVVRTGSHRVKVEVRRQGRCGRWVWVWVWLWSGRC
jgi:hypothetical protein